jgi:hydroxyacylglutathione hydrolase
MIVARFIVGELRTNCYLVTADNETAAMVIDPGDRDEAMRRSLTHLAVEEILIVATHYHYDHTTGIAALRSLRPVKVFAHTGERGSARFQVDEWLEDGYEFNLGGEALAVIHTPGHSAGSICLSGPDCLFSGDTLLPGCHGRTDLPSGSAAAMRSSLERLVRKIPAGVKVYPGHGQTFPFEPAVIHNMLKVWPGGG